MIDLTAALQDGQGEQDDVDGTHTYPSLSENPFCCCEDDDEVVVVLVVVVVVLCASQQEQHTVDDEQLQFKERAPTMTSLQI